MTKKKSKKIFVKTGNITYPAGDFLIRFKNAAMATRSDVSAPHTKFVEAIAKVLKETGFASKVESKDGMVVVGVAKHSKKSLLMGLSLVSRPGLRVYMDASNLAKKKGPEIYIVSTNKGVMSSKSAIKKVIGGEVIAKIW